MLTTTPVQDIDQIYLNAEKQLRQYSTGLNLPQELYTIANQLARQYYNSYISYRKYCADMINLQNIKERAIDWQLQQNLFYWLPTLSLSNSITLIQWIYKFYHQIITLWNYKINFFFSEQYYQLTSYFTHKTDLSLRTVMYSWATT